MKLCSVLAELTFFDVTINLVGLFSFASGAAGLARGAAWHGCSAGIERV